MSISEVIVKGTYKKADGKPETGTVKFRPALWQQSTSGIDAVLDSTGSFQTKFPSSDSGNWPDGLQIPYRVTVAVSSGTYVKELTFKSADSPIDLPTLFPIVSNSGGGGGGSGGDYLPLSGGTLSGNLEIERAAGDATLSLDGQGGTLRAAQIRTGGTLRWSVGAAPTAETGGNAGSDLAIGRYDDSGNWVDNPLDISRRDGGVNVKSLWVKDGGWIGNVPNPSGPKDAANKDYVDSRLPKVTRPNGTDLLVQYLINGVWTTVAYDSGWRDISALLEPGWKGTVLVRRDATDLIVHVSPLAFTAEATSDTFWKPPSGWGYLAGVMPGEESRFGSIPDGGVSTRWATIVLSGAGLVCKRLVGNVAPNVNHWGSARGACTRTIPTILPGIGKETVPGSIKLG